MLKIIKVNKNSIFSTHKIDEDDYILEINGNRIEDIIDYKFYSSFPGRLKFLFQKSDGNIKKIVARSEDFFYGDSIDFEEIKVKRCRNKCIFCFCDQHPESARESLYFKDEDYRLSFLYGNYITLSNITADDYKKIIEMRLSPLYISVHSTDDKTRRKMLGVLRAPEIMDRLSFLAENGIQMHIQIVLVPGVNDSSLGRTIEDLFVFFPYIQSIAVVPVGLTRFRKKLPVLKPVGRLLAKKIVTEVTQMQRVYLKKIGNPLVYLSDEFYIISDMKIPDRKHYLDFPQIENGVGFISKFKYEFYRKVKRASVYFDKTKKFIAISGLITRGLFDEINQFLIKDYSVAVETHHIKNNYFGGNVSVTGLLTGCDIMRHLYDLKTKNIINGNTVILLPDTVLRHSRDLFLDDLHINDLLDKFPVLIVGSDAEGYLYGLSKAGKKSRKMESHGLL